MNIYKVPFDFTHEEKVFRWVSIFKTNDLYNCKHSNIGNNVF